MNDSLNALFNWDASKNLFEFSFDITVLFLYYIFLFMLLNEQALALHNTVHEMGYESLEDFALQKARQDLLYEITVSQQKIEIFEKKYGVDYADFCKRFQQLNQLLFEKEEDSAEWNAEIKQLSILQKRLARIA